MRRYVIMGTGAVGGTVGGRLAQHDIPVVWVARGEHGEVLAREGMTLRTPDETIEVRATVWASPEQAELGPDDVLVLAVKTQQAAEALAAKLVSNMVNAIDALFVRSEASKRLIKDAQAEARAVLAATGEAVVGDEEESANRLRAQIAPVPGAPGEMGSSTYQSIARGTGSVETDYINGEIVRLGRVHGVPTPVNTALASLTRRAAAQGWQPRSQDAAALRIRPAG